MNPSTSGWKPARGSAGSRARNARRCGLPCSAAGIVYSLIGAAVFATGAYIWKYGDPNGGWPRAVARIEPYKPPVVAAKPDTAPTGTIERRAERHTGQEIENQSGVKVTRAGGGDAPGALIIQLDHAASVSLTPAPDRRLVERGRFGSLPRIGADGAKPYEIYARPVITSQKLKADAPRIALIVGGLGLSNATTDAAMDKLPADVSFAFAPYGAEVQADAAKARERGHETFLQAPMSRSTIRRTIRPPPR
ncbi:MAG: divergent polysaccharide deacetylase family protein [Methylobacteriaceae bacterium]|nr:divergent polysaccharide deacetylase family protein [Methylobacteriaceae bacterium]